MPTVEENHSKWDGSYHWDRNGDKWSDPWGSVEMQWHGSLLPRIQRHLPNGTILEIAPGFGRWTQFLAPLCDRLIVVDLSAKCIEACRRRFADRRHLEYHVNDGRSLDMIADNSIDFAFSFDSLVHVEDDVIRGYLEQLGQKLKPGGTAFIHHSNIGEYAGYFRALSAVAPLRLLLRTIGAETKTHGRGSDVSAGTFAQRAAQAGLRCVSQEIINWRSSLLTDCFTVLRRETPVAAGGHPLLRNRKFMAEAAQLAALSKVYATPDQPDHQRRAAA